MKIINVRCAMLAAAALAMCWSAQAQKIGIEQNGHWKS